MNLNFDIITQNANVSFDTTAPLSYNEWLLKNSQIAPAENSVNLYNLYIQNWYTVNDKTELNSAAAIKQDYISLLKELTHFFTDEEKNLFLKDINFDDDVELIYAIPFFVQKLKQIALTIAKRRDDIKQSRFKYNLVGSTRGVELLLREYILKFFTQSFNSVQLSTNTAGLSFPQLTAVKDDFFVTVEDTFDTSTYADLEEDNQYTSSVPSVYNSPLSYIFAEFLKQYNTNTLPISSYNEYSKNSTPTVYNEIKLNEKYLGNNLYSINSSGVTGLEVQATAPHLNLQNTTNSTIAVQPSKLNIITKSDVGGYLLPHNLRVPYYLGHGFTNTLNTDKISNQLNSLFKDPNIYTSNRGLTKKDNPSPFETTYIDNTWIKESYTSGKKAGVISNAVNYQKFTPYQSNYETLKTNIYGVSRQKDIFEFWSGPNSNIWNDEVNYPLNFKKENYKIDERVEKLLVTENIAAVWCTDIYGNNYSIFKPKTWSIADTEEREGSLWVRSVSENISTGPVFFENLYNNLPRDDHYIKLIQNQIVSIDVYEDIIILKTKHGISLHKITFNVIEEIISPNLNLISTIQLYPTVSSVPSARCMHGGTWYDEAKKHIYINVIEFINTGDNKTRINYYMHKYDILRGVYKTVLQDIIASPVFIEFPENIKSPISFTYNQDTKNFITTVVFNTFDMYVIESKNYEDINYISSVTLIS